MKISNNFAFLKQEFPYVAESASFPEHQVYRGMLCGTGLLVASFQSRAFSGEL